MPNRNYRYVERVLQSPGVRRKIRTVRDRKARAAAGIAAAEGETVRITLSEGIRPRGRPYARISIPAVNEFGDHQHKRLRLLGRIVNL